MKISRMRLIAGWIALSGIATAASAAAPNTPRLSFDANDLLPAGWQAGATGGKPAEWKVGRDARAPSPPNVLSVVRFNDTSRGTFNLFWTPAARFHNGSIEVNIRANTGDIDQGGGLLWRVQDENNYYIARYNPLEKNLRLYVVKNGSRSMLVDAPNLGVGGGEWFALKITHRGERIQAWLNGKKLIETTDATFAGAGGAGVWTKADAASSFDDFTLRHDRGTPVTEE